MAELLALQPQLLEPRVLDIVQLVASHDVDPQSAILVARRRYAQLLLALHELAIVQIESTGSVDPIVLATRLGLEVIETRGMAFTVGSVGDTFLYRWDESAEIRDARVWEGIAQCLLGRLGIEWSVGQAVSLAGRLQHMAQGGAVVSQ